MTKLQQITLFILFLLACVGSPAIAQVDDSGLADPTQISRALDEFERSLATPSDETQADAIREQALSLRADARALAGAWGQQRDQIRELLTALGPPPASGQSESDDIARERKRLTGVIAELEGKVQRANLLAARAEAVERRAALVQRSLSAGRIFARGGSLFSAETWEKAGKDLAEMRDGLGAEITSAFQNAPADSLPGMLLPYLPFAAVLLIAAGQLICRRLARLTVRRAELRAPTDSEKLRWALAMAAARIVPRVCAAILVYLPLAEFFADTPALSLILDEVFYVSLTGISGHALAAFVLAPGQNAWRLLHVPERVAAAWPRAIALFALPAAADRIIAALAQSYGRFAETVFILNLPVVLFAAAVTTYLALNGFTPRTRAAQRMRAAFFIAVVLLAVTPFAGYFALARFALIKIVISILLGAAAWLLFRLSERGIDAVLAPTAEEAARAQGGGQLLGWWLKAAAAVFFFLTGIGGIAITWGASRSDAASIAADMAGGFDIGGVTVSPLDVLAAVLVFALGLAAVRFLQRILETKLLPRTRMDHGAQNAVRAGFGYAGVLVAVLAAISTAGFDLTNLAIIAGALSVGIGFGLQTIVNNFVSGLILLIERPFQVGDWIVTGADEGYVRNIKVRATEIQTFDNAIVTVPNSDLVTGRVLNWTHRDMSGRVIVRVGVAYGTDPETVRQILLTVATDHPLVLRHPEPLVLFNAFGDSSLQFELRVILSDVTKRLQARSELHFAIEKKLRACGISVPFPQRDVHIKGLEKLEGAIDAFTQAMRRQP